MSFICYRCNSWPCECSDGITLVHGDCKTILPRLEPGSVDLVLTDPPYGIDLTQDGCNTRNVNRDIAGDSEPFDPTHLLAYDNAIIWGGNNFAASLPPGGWLAWDKRILNDKSNLANQCDGELAWTNTTKRILFFRHLWIGAFRKSEQKYYVHPSQKPVALMRWCLSIAGCDGVVLDPYAGSGPVGRACKDLGRKCIMIEIEERYCRIASERLRQEVLF